MSVRRWGRCLVPVFIVLAAGCGTKTDVSNACRWNPGSCMHEGKYDADERDYAEEEAARLNRAESRRMRRSW